MRIEKRETFCLSQEEANTWKNFSLILEEIEKKSSDSYILDIIGEIIGHMSDLWDEVEEIEQ